MTEKQQLMSLDDVAAWLGVPVRTLYSWRANNKGPRGIRVGKYVRYRPADVEAWIESNADREVA